MICRATSIYLRSIINELLAAEGHLDHGLIIDLEYFMGRHGNLAIFLMVRTWKVQI